MAARPRAASDGARAADVAAAARGRAASAAHAGNSARERVLGRYVATKGCVCNTALTLWTVWTLWRDIGLSPARAEQHSWKGKYQRVFVVTTRRVYTLDPGDAGAGAAPTNSYEYGRQLCAIHAAGGAAAVGATRLPLELVISVRGDAGQKTKEIRWGCTERAALLSDAHRGLALAAATGLPRLEPLLVPDREFAARRLRRGAGEWLSVKLVVSAHGVREIDAQSGQLVWELEYRDMAAPAAAVLADEDAFVLRGGRGFSPRCFGGLGRSRAMLDAMCSAAAGAVGVQVSMAAGGGSGGAGGSLIVEGFRAQQAERRRRMDIADAPLATFRAVRLKGPPGASRGSGARIRRVERSLHVHEACLVERRADYAACLSRPLAALSAVVRYEADPQRFGLDFRDGSPPLEYECARRDELLSALVDAAYATVGPGVRYTPVSLIPARGGASSRVGAPRPPAAQPTVQSLMPREYGVHIRAGGAGDTPEADDEMPLERLGLRRLVTAAKALSSALGGTDAVRLALSEFGGPADVSPAARGPEKAVRLALRGMNVDVAYSGFRLHFLSAKEAELVMPVLALLLPPARRDAKDDAVGADEATAAAVVTIETLQALVRLTASAPVPAAAFLSASGATARLAACLRSLSAGVAAEACRLLSSLVDVGSEAQRSAAKSGLLSNPEACAALVACVQRGARRHGARRIAGETSSLLSVAAACVLEQCICLPGRNTTAAPIMEHLLAECAAAGRALFGLFTHPASKASDVAVAVMRTLAEEASPERCAATRDAALADGAVLAHLRAALFHDRAPRREESQALVAMWCDGHPASMALLGRCLPEGLIAALSEPKALAASSSSGAGESLRANAEEANSSRRRTSSLSSSRLRGNWLALWEAAERDSADPALVWNGVTRTELRDALDREIGGLDVERQREVDAGAAPNAGCATGSGCVSWNHREFYVRYPSLEGEVRIKGTFVRHLIEADSASRVAANDRGKPRPIRDPADFFATAYRELLELADADVAPLGSEQSRRQTKRHMCVQAMTAAYRQQASVIGPFQGAAHVTRLLDLTLDAALRDHLLELCHALVTRDNAPSVVEVNASNMVDEGLVEVLCGVVACSHGAGERQLMPMASNLIAATAHVEPLKVWYFIAGGEECAATSAAALAAFEPWDVQSAAPQGVQCVGPLSRVELRQALSHDKVGGGSHVRAKGMAWEALRDVRELRWMAAQGRRALSPQEAAALALEALLAITNAVPDVDASGDAVRPIPKAKRRLCLPECLPHITQAMLCGDAAVVDRAAQLLLALVRRNPRTLARLYRTGVFYFALAYPGSNLGPIAELLCETHMRQDVTAVPGAGAAAGIAAGSSLSARSALGDLLPESLLQIAESYGASRLAEALAADADTPELIWTRSMREERLVTQISQHLGEFPRVLLERHGATHDFVPIAPVTYPALDDEVWCHRYYLRSLADEERFPGWPIRDVVDVVRALLSAWRAELAKKPMAMTETEAAAELGLDEGWASLPRDKRDTALKKAYRSLAMRYHPDKNPGGLAKFRSARSAYDRLRAGAAGAEGAAPWRVVLLLRAQGACYRRNPSELAPFLYAGFPLLLEELERAAGAPPGALAPAPASGETAADRAGTFERAAAASELILRICMASVQNGDEVARLGGVAPLGGLLARTAATAPADAPPSDHRCRIGADVLRTLAGLAGLDAARPAFLKESAAGVVRDVVRCTRLGDAPVPCEGALRCCGHLCASHAMQGLMARAGLMFRCLALMLRYDSTLIAADGDSDESGDAADAAAVDSNGKSTTDPGAPAATLPSPQASASALAIAPGDAPPEVLAGPSAPTNVQRARNVLAVRASEVLARLCGCLGATSGDVSKANANVVTAMLTPGIARLLARGEHRKALGILTSSAETVTIVWNSATRAELESHLDKALAIEPGEDGYDLERHAEFIFDALKDELVVGGVYLRVYNQRPQPLANPVAFAGTTVKFAVELADDALSGGDQAAACARATAALAAARSSLANAPPSSSVDALPLGTLAVWLVAAAAEDGAEGGVASVAVAAARVVEAACALPGAPKALGAALVRRMYQLLASGSADVRACAIASLALVADDAAVAAEGAVAGGMLYALGALLPADGDDADCTPLPQRLRVPCAALVGRLLRHPARGERATALCSAWLPAALVETLRDGSASVADALVASSETPELVWSRKLAAVTGARLRTACREQAAQQAAQGNAFEASIGGAFSIDGELYVGGVFVRLFVKDPAFPLRDPKRSAEALIDFFVQNAGASEAEAGAAAETDVVLVSTATVLLVRSQPAMGEHLASLGHIKRLSKLLRAPDTPAGTMANREGGALRLVHQLAAGENACEALAACVDVAARLRACARCGAAAASLAIEALARALASGNRRRDALVQRCLSGGEDSMLKQLLSFVGGEGSEDGAADDADAQVVRALAVDAVRLLAADGAFAEDVRAKLAQSEAWAAHGGSDLALHLPAAARAESGGAAALVAASGMLALPDAATVTRSALQEQEENQVAASAPPAAGAETEATAGADASAGSDGEEDA